jgi:hypothetical protein
MVAQKYNKTFYAIEIEQNWQRSTNKSKKKRM